MTKRKPRVLSPKEQADAISERNAVRAAARQKLSQQEDLPKSLRDWLRL